MKRTLQLIVSIVIVMGVGCKRESNSARETDVVPQNPKVDAVKRLLLERATKWLFPPNGIVLVQYKRDSTRK